MHIMYYFQSWDFLRLRCHLNSMNNKCVIINTGDMVICNQSCVYWSSAHMLAWGKHTYMHICIIIYHKYHLHINTSYIYVYDIYLSHSFLNSYFMCGSKSTSFIRFITNSVLWCSRLSGKANSMNE